MKKFMLILIVSTVVFASCASPVDEAEVEPVNPFEGRWLDIKYNKIVEFRDNTWCDPYNNYTYEYDDTYIYQRFTDAGFTHIYITFRYEFRDNGNELHLYWVNNIYGAYPGDDHFILQKIDD